MAKISDVIKILQKLKEEHGDLDVYETDDAAVFEYQTDHRPKAYKMYTQKWEDAIWMKDQLSYGNLNEEDDELYDVDKGQPIFKAVIL